MSGLVFLTEIHGAKKNVCSKFVFESLLSLQKSNVAKSRKDIIRIIQIVT